MHRAAVVVGLGLIAGCGRLGFDELGPLEADVRVIAGATSVDVEVCANRATSVRTAVSVTPWPAGWDASSFGPDVTKLTAAGCTTTTHVVTTPDASVSVYALAGDLDPLPLETTVMLQPMLSARTMAVAGGHTQRYWVHYPESYYRDPTAPLPVLLAFAGQGENGDDAGTGFDLLDNRGVLAPFTQRRAAILDLPFLVIAPQCNTDRGNCWIGQEANMDEVLAHAAQTATFDAARIYVTGLSTGGEGAIRFAIHAENRLAGVHVAAVVPISSTNSSPGYYTANMCQLRGVPMWAFHNTDDTTQSVQNSRDYVALLNACSPLVPAQLDEGTGGHNAWSRVYNDSHTFTNNGATSMYDWLLAFSR